MSINVINTKKAPAAIGPYSQAIGAGGFLFLSGQIPIDPATGDIVPGRIEEQTKQVFKNILGILDEAGLSVSDVVKTTIFLWDIKDFNTVNLLYEGFFASPFPARSCVAVSALPKGSLIEIEIIAKT